MGDTIDAVRDKFTQVLHGFDLVGPRDELSDISTILRKFGNEDTIHITPDAGFMVFVFNQVGLPTLAC